MRRRSKTATLIGLILMIGSILIFIVLPARPLWAKILLAFMFSLGITTVLRYASRKPAGAVTPVSSSEEHDSGSPFEDGTAR